MGITNKTAELLRKNKELQKDLDGLKHQTNAFVHSVLSNPENQNMLKGPSPISRSVEIVSPAPAMATPAVMVAQPATMIATNASENADFNRILSGIYDFELPSVILAPVAMDQVLQENSLPGASNLGENHAVATNFSPSVSSSSPPRKRPKIK